MPLNVSEVSYKSCECFRVGVLSDSVYEVDSGTVFCATISCVKATIYRVFTHHKETKVNQKLC